MELKEDSCSNTSFVQGVVERSLTNLPAQSCSPAQLQRLSPAALAYLGDAVYELYIRTSFLLPPKRSQLYHQQVVAQVRAESQAYHLQVLEPYLTDLELEVLRRGRNAASGKPKRLDLETYQQATSLEALLGHLYLTDPQRLNQLLSHLQPHLVLEESPSKA